MNQGSCPDYRDSIELYVDGELSADAASALTAHLVECPSCAARVAELSELVSLLKPAQGGSPDESRFWRRFEAELSLRVARGETPFWRRSIALSFPTAITALGLVFALALVAFSKHREATGLAQENAQLKAAVRELANARLFPNQMVVALASPTPLPTPELSGSVMKVFHPAMRAPVERKLAPGMEIRLVDDPGQARDMY